MAEPTGQFSLALDDDTLVWAPTWTDVAQDNPNLVTSYTIDRGRQFELDHTDVGRATVVIADKDGVLDPTNASGPYFGRIRPFHQAAIARWNPVTDDWWTRFRGFVESYSYDFDPSQKVNRLTVSLVDLQGLLSAVEMVPGLFGISTAGTEFEGQIGFPIQTMGERINAALGDAVIPLAFSVIFSGNVELHATLYSPGESVMTVIQDAVDGEWPGVGNAFVDRFGRLACHGRYARFDPAAVLAGPPPDPYLTWDAAWDFHIWNAGDGAYVNGAPGSRAQVRAFAFEQGVSKVYNSALATPQGIADADVVTGTPVLVGGSMYQDGQHTYDTGSLATYGYRSWSAQNLQTRRGLVDDSTDLVECQRFGQWIVGNYATARNRVTTITFRSMRPTDPRAAHNWALLSKVDIADKVVVAVGSPGGGGFSEEEFYVEGVHESASPLNANYDDVTLSLDLSPVAYFDDNPFPVP